MKEPTGYLKAVKTKASPSRLWVRADGAIAYLNGWLSQALYLRDRTYAQEHYRPPDPKKDQPAPKPIPRF